MKIDFKKPLKVYFVGIGGISMSGIASIINAGGFKVSGSDSKKSDLTEKLEREGITVFFGQDFSHVPEDTELVVYTAAIKKDNPDLLFAKEHNIPSMTRAEFLGLLLENYNTPIAISGTHGKTTTTSMISEIMLEADKNPTISNGGVLQSIGSNIFLGGTDYFVFEACEYTNSFLSFFPKISVILNVEEDHLDFFKDIDDIRNSFNLFAKHLPSDGLLVICNDIKNKESVLKDISCPYVTYGMSDTCDYYATDITFDEKAHPSFVCHRKKDGYAFNVSLSVTGEHNVLNALAAIAVTDYLNVGEDAIKAALLKCSGSKRRFEYRGTFDGVTVIDDYAHHPTEIKATLTAAKEYPHKTLWCVFQPHTYTRTKAFLKEFAQALSLADKVILADVYPAREKDIYGCNSQNLYEELLSLGCDVTYLHSFEEIEKIIHKNTINGDLLITVGAGDVVKIADNLTS